MLTMLMENAGTTGLIIRRTFKQLDGNHVRPLFRQFPEMRNWYNKSENVLYLPNASQLMFGHSEHEDDVFQYQGQEFDCIFVEEVTQFTEFQWQMISTSNRTSKPGVKPVMWATGNPGGVGHLWVKRLWVDKLFDNEIEDAENYEYIPAKVYDNPALMAADPAYIKILKAIKDEHLRRAYLDGDWDIYPGQYFSMWQNSEIVKPSFEIPSDWQLYGALDYGEVAPASFGLYAIDYDGVVWRIMEYYQGERTGAEHAREIRHRIESCPFTGGRPPSLIYADPSMWTKRRLHEKYTKSPTDVFQEEGLYLTRANNDRINGWRACKDALVHGTFKVFEGWNDHFVRTVPALPRSEKNIEDLNTEAEDHAADEWRYGMIHFYRPMARDLEEMYGNGQDILDDLDSDGKSVGRYHITQMN